VLSASLGQHQDGLLVCQTSLVCVYKGMNRGLAGESLLNWFMPLRPQCRLVL
jgi:hypothetical protein